MVHDIGLSTQWWWVQFPLSSFLIIFFWRGGTSPCDSWKKSGCDHENNILILIQGDNSVERKGDRLTKRK